MPGTAIESAIPGACTRIRSKDMNRQQDFYRSSVCDKSLFLIRASLVSHRRTHIRRYCMQFLLEDLYAVTWQQLILYPVGIFLIWLAVKKEYEPSLLLPMGFGTILVNLPFSGVLDQMVQGTVPAAGIIEWLYKVGISSSEMMPLLLFIGIGAMIDFGPLLSQPFFFLFSAAAQFGIFAAILIACLLGFDLRDAVSIGIIGAADGPTSILVSQVLESRYIGPIAVAAYSYMALVPIIQPMAIKLVTTKKERQIRMSYRPKHISKATRIAFPVAVTIIVGFLSPQSVSLVGFLMFGNLLRECGVLNSLSQSAQHELVNLITLLLGITISFSMRAEVFVTVQTLLIMGIGLLAFFFDTIAGVLFAKLMNLLLRIAGKPPVNPMIGACGISAFPMSSRVVQKLASEAQKGNVILMQAAGTNAAGQIASVLAGGLVISLVSQYL